MIDTLNISCYSGDMGGVNFIEETAQHLNITGEHYNENGAYLSGSIGNLGVYIRDRTLRINKGSLCKWHLGDNWQTLTRGDTERAIEHLSDILHLPMSKAMVTRIDVAQNIILKHPTTTYIEHLGAYYPYKRLLQPDGVLYAGAKKQLLLYDKLKEQKHKREPIPELYQDRHTLRIEQRYTGSPHKALGVEVLRCSDLCSESIYSTLARRWRDSYLSIKKINDITLNFEAMRTKKDMYTLGVLALIEKAGGVNEFATQIAEAVRYGTLTKKQAFDLRQAVKQATATKVDIVTPNEAILELDKKVKEVVKFI